VIDLIVRIKEENVKQLRMVLLVLLILAVATLACSVGSKAPTSQSEQLATQAPEAPATEAQPQEAEATETPTAEAVETPEAEVTEAPPESTEEVQEEADLDLNTSISGLESLNSYRASFRFDWNGIKDDQPVTGYMAMRSAFVREPPAQELYFEGQGFEGDADQGLGQVSFVQVGDTAWFYESESDSWMQVPAGSLDFAEGLFFQPEDLLKDFDVSKGRRSLVPEQVNGVQSYKYTFDENDFDLNDPSTGEQVTRAQGEVYVAVDGGYVVRLVVDADFNYENPDELFEEGNVKMTFDISDVNQPITIEPPAEAEAQAGGRDDIPMLPNATVDFASAELISYKTASSAEEAAGFYQEEMTKNGWTAEEDTMTFEGGAFLNYTKGSETASIIISSEEDGTSVLINVTQE
jgi:cytoskeletal protein RodZ